MLKQLLLYAISYPHERVWSISAFEMRLSFISFRVIFFFSYQKQFAYVVKRY